MLTVKALESKFNFRLHLCSYSLHSKPHHMTIIPFAELTRMPEHPLYNMSESAKKPTRDEVQSFILKQTGLALEPCEQFRSSRAYYNFKLKNRASESDELETLLRFLPRQSLIKRVEPNGAQRIAVFV